MRILGIDPGFSVTGYGILEKNGTKAILRDYGYLSLPTSKNLIHRIGLFHDFFEKKIVEHQITHCALETPFLGKNAQNFLKLGYLRGNLYLLAHKHNLAVYEFSPREVKQSVTGYGGAQKEQVAHVILKFFPGMEKPKKEDVTDALAVTLCGLWAIQREIIQGKAVV